MTTDTQLLPLLRNPVVKVGGSAASADDLARLVDIRVERALNDVGHAVLRFTTGLGDVAAGWTTLGTAIAITTHDAKPVFSGHVTGYEVTYVGGDRLTTVSAHEPMHRLGGRSKVRTFNKVKASDVIGTLLKESGLKASVDATTVTFDYLIQTGSDLEEVDRLASRNGMDWWVGADGAVAVAKLTVGTATSTRSVSIADLARASVRASATRPSELTVRGWSLENEEVRSNKKLAKTHLGATGDAADAVAGYTEHPQPHEVVNFAVISQSEADLLAEAALVRAASGAVHAEFEGPFLWDVAPGSAIELTDGGKELAGTYLVTEVDHRWTDGALSSRIVSGDRRPRHAVRGEGGGAGTPTIVVGRVTDLDDPKKKGRVRVLYPGLDGKEQSDWARVLAAGAGGGKGTTVLPSVKDEVLLTFEGGDLRKAVVLGSLYTKDHTLPTSTLEGGKWTRSTLASHYGHSIELWEGSGKQGLEIKLKNGGLIRISDAGTELIGVKGKTTTLTQGQAKIELKESGDILIEGTNITVKGKVKVAVEGQTAVDVKSNATVTLDGTMVDVKAKGKGTVNGGGMLELKGGLVKIN